MNFKPSDFFISLMEFFSIFLPGFIVAFLFSNEFYSVFIIKGGIINNATSWTAYYFVSSYIFGHFAYGAGGAILEAFRRINKLFIKRWEVQKAVEIMHEQIKSIEENERSESNKKKISRKGKNRIQKWVDSIKNALKRMRHHSKPLEGNENSIREKKMQRKEIMWLQKWADSIIQIKHPQSLISVRQYEADAKFFRSFFIVSLWGLLHSIWSHDKSFPWWYWIISTMISFLLNIYWKYEAIKEASNIIVTMESMGEFKNDSAVTR